MKPSEHGCQYIRSSVESQSKGFCWQVMVAGDADSVSSVVDQALKGLVVDGAPVQMFQVFSLTHAKETLANNSDIALALMDIPPDRACEWLDLVPWIREDLGNARVRIAICMEGSDQDIEKKLFNAYDINDFIAKSNRTPHHLEILAKKALRTARAFLDLETELCRKRQIESQLEEKKAAFNDLIENIGDMVWQTDRDSRFTYISANAMSLYGYTREELLEKCFDFSLVRETRTNNWPEIEAAIADRRQFTNIDISRTHKDGSLRYFLTSGRPVFGKNGKWEGYRGAEKDITALVHSEQEKKRLISQLRHAQRLEAMGTLAGGIAHDFNNILGGILGYAQLIQFEIKKNPVAMAHTKHIISGCNRAKNLILQILDFSRQRESTSPSKATNPGKIVTEAVKLLRASLPSSIKIKTRLHKNTGQILADPSQIHQAVMNLCTNAGQAIETGMGTITVEVAPVVLTRENHLRSPELDLDYGNYVTISVTDTGKGIETNTLEKIFNPYFTTKKRGDGSGLGLSVVHGIVTRFEGTVTVTTTPGEGSVFTLYFPQYTPKKQPPKEHRPKLMTGESNVLFIDDEPMLVDVARMMLEKLGYRVTALNSAVEGLKLVQSNPEQFDIVITDMTMPDILGTQLAVQVKQMNPGLPVVLATGFSNLVQTQKANPSGIDAVLPKPITMASLSQTLYQLLNG